MKQRSVFVVYNNLIEEALNKNNNSQVPNGHNLREMKQSRR